MPPCTRSVAMSRRLHTHARKRPGCRSAWLAQAEAERNCRRQSPRPRRPRVCQVVGIGSCPRHMWDEVQSQVQLSEDMGAVLCTTGRDRVLSPVHQGPMHCSAWESNSILIGRQFTKETRAASYQGLQCTKPTNTRFIHQTYGKRTRNLARHLHDHLQLRVISSRCNPSLPETCLRRVASKPRNPVRTAISQAEVHSFRSQSDAHEQNDGIGSKRSENLNLWWWRTCESYVCSIYTHTHTHTQKHTHTHTRAHTHRHTHTLNKWEPCPPLLAGKHASSHPSSSLSCLSGTGTLKSKQPYPQTLDSRTETQHHE